MTKVRITVQAEDGDRLVTATANYYDPAIESDPFSPGQQAHVEYDLDPDVEIDEDDDRRVRDALLDKIERGE